MGACRIEHGGETAASLARKRWRKATLQERAEPSVNGLSWRIHEALGEGEQMTEDNGTGKSRLGRIEESLERLHASHMELHADIQALHINIESLHASVSDLYAIVLQHSRDIEKDGENIRADSENIRGALARIAEIHEHRLTELEGGDDGKSPS